MARNIGVNFNGKRIVKPGAHSRIDANGLGAFGSSSEKKLVFLGSAEGGEPNKFLSFTNYADARDTLRGGDLLTAGELAWSPSGDGIGAGEIGFIRVEDATQATLVKDGLTLTSILYGADANNIQAKLEEGTVTGSRRLTLYFWKDSIREIYDNLGPVFSIQYTGTQTYASIDITVDANGNATQLTLKAGADSATAVDVKDYSLGDNAEFSAVNKLINDINNLPDFTAKITDAGNKNLSTKVLDAVTAQEIITTPFVVTALKGDILDQLQYSRLVTATISGVLPADFPSEYFTGGSNGTVPASWADKLDNVVGEGAYIIVPLTADEAIHAEVQRFVEQQTSSENQEMRAFYGGALGETIEDVINRAVTLNSSRATVCYPAITRKSISGDVETLPAYFSAAIIAGRVAGVPIGEPVTFDYLNLIGLEKILSSSDIDTLIENGIAPIEYVSNNNQKGFRIAQCVTTYQDDNNPVYRENSIGEISDFLNFELRNRLETKFVGTKGLAVTPALIKNEVQSFLDQKVRDEWIVEYDPNSVTVVENGEVVQVTYACMPAFSVNYVLITGAFYQTTLTA